jgi:hypothetical protein
LRAFVAGGEAAAWLVDMTEVETSTGDSRYVRRRRR